MSIRRSLVTGGGGFIGLHLVQQLLEHGETVRVLELPDVPLPSNVETIRGSVCDAKIVRKALKDVQRVYHLAANPNLWAHDKNDFKRINYEGTCTVLQEAAKCDLEVIVHTSTESIFAGKSRLEAEAGIGARKAVHNLPGPYSRSKFFAEQAAIKAAEDGMPVVIVAPALPIGPGDRKITPPTRMILDFINARPPAYLECGFNLIDVRDVAAGHILAAEHGRCGDRYILGNENIMLSGFLRMIEDITGLAMPKIRIPYWTALVAGAISEFLADYVTRRQPRAPLTGVRLARYPLYFDSEKAIQELGLPQNSVYQALADEIEWLSGEGLITRRLPMQQRV
ncbi:dihydroflavonol-4-reductase [Nitrosomonas sp. Nm51]|uniref:NAD-dependent epimerase/dehydratase family protein n=1 Tax=Nitrosomonas sp. Nm51 TaxID=133720 RepID=UPI0008BB9BCE|nr:NAD-dependent epimerase/dehydratase family protein [Nitrosomonas sp. Nm51]SER04399.1 dihydroflavonol-4-reductase [Nitrosomonas sp. Nm51]